MAIIGNKRFFRRIISIVAMSFIFFTFKPISSKTTFAAENYQGVINDAPIGLNILDYFDVGKFQKTNSEAEDYPFQTNSSTVYNSGDSTDKHNGRVLNVVKGGGSRDVGAAWSKGDNYIDINKKQTVSVWLYFGSGDSIDYLSNGEGVSLVLQNDPRKTSAMGAGMQALGSMGADDATIGADGFKSLLGGEFIWTEKATGATTNTPQEAAQTAVANSIALNFKSQENSLSGSRIQEPTLVGESEIKYGLTKLKGTKTNHYSLNSFDTEDTADTIPQDFPELLHLLNINFGSAIPSIKLGTTGQSYGAISLSYPGNPITYKSLSIPKLKEEHSWPSDFSSLTSGSEWPYISKGNDDGTVLSTYQVARARTNLIDSSDEFNNPLYWHHVTFTWTPKKGDQPATISYAYNDKYPDGTVNTGQSNNYDLVKLTIPVDVSAFNNPTDGRVYWGLTGANNVSASFSKLAVFESIPAMATAQVTTSLYDHDLKKTITDDSEDKMVNNGDDLSFLYNLKWDENSRENWQNVVSKINLPTDVKYQSATITYQDANGNETQPLEVADESGLTSESLKYTLTHDLGTIISEKGYTSAVIYLNGQADNKSGEVVTVSSAAANFIGDNAIESTSTPEFQINNNKAIEKILKLTVSDELNFQDINYQARQEYLTRKNDFSLTVTSLKSPWKLEVSTDGLFLGEEKFDGNLVYLKDQSSDPMILTSSEKLFAQDLTAHSEKTINHLAAGWSDETGLLLAPDEDEVSTAGTYKGTLNWTLVNSISN